LKPILIYKFEKEEMHLQDELMEMMINDQNALNEIYTKIVPNNLHKSIVSGAGIDGDFDNAINRLTSVVQEVAMREQNKRVSQIPKAYRGSVQLQKFQSSLAS
jgi:hypothetical protein